MLGKVNFVVQRPVLELMGLATDMAPAMPLPRNVHVTQAGRVMIVVNRSVLKTAQVRPFND